MTNSTLRIVLKLKMNYETSVTRIKIINKRRGLLSKLDLPLEFIRNLSQNILKVGFAVEEHT